MKQQVVIIGAGVSGLVTAKALLEYGYDVTVLEKQNEIGGVWASCRHYPGLTTQNTKDTYFYSDFPMPDIYPDFPSGNQMLEYLTAYAKKFNVLPHILFNKNVVSIKYDEPGNQKLWQIKIEENSQTSFIDADILIVCNGTFSEPFMPVVKGMNTFKDNGGSIVHTTTIKDPEKLKNKKIIVLGYGKSACDVAASISAFAQQVHLIYREAKWKVPKKIKGISYKYVVLSRFGEALTKFNYHSTAEKIIHSLRIPKLAFGILQKVFARQQRLKETGLHPSTGIADLLVGELSVESDNFYKQVIAKKIIPVQSEVEAFTNKGVILKNGQALDADVVIYGTGFVQQSPFLSEEVIDQITDVQGNYILYRNILPIDLRGILFNGYNASFFCTLTSEIAAYWICEYLEGNILLPGKKEMLEHTLSFLKNRKQNRRNALCKGASVWPFNLTYVDWLLRDMHTKLPLKALLSEWLKVINPAHYAPVTKALKGKSKLRKLKQKEVFPNEENMIV